MTRPTPRKESDGSLPKDTQKCPCCGSTQQYWEVRNYEMMWHSGDVYCKICNSFIRYFDAD